MDISQGNWNEVDDNNSTAAPDGAPEGMPPSGVNNTMRAMMGAIKRWYDQSIPKTTDPTGTSTAYTLSYSVVPTTLADGMTFLVKFDKTCGYAPMLNVNSLGAKPIYGWYASAGTWVPVNAGDIVAGQKLRLSYDQASGNFHVLQPFSGFFTGFRGAFLGTLAQVPAGWVPLRGNSIGDASSGATERANADTQALFTLLWANTSLVLQNSSGATVSRGATAAADYAAHCRLVLPNYNAVFPRSRTDGTAPGGAGGSTSLQGGTTSGSLSVSASGSARTFNDDDAYWQAGSGGVNVSTAPHQHSFSVSVDGSTSGSLSVSGTVTPPYVDEIAMVKL